MWPEVVAAIQGLRLKVHLQARDAEPVEAPTEWSSFLTIPVPGCIETACGPVAFQDIEWLLVNPIRTTHRGVRVPPLVEDLTSELTGHLNRAGATYTLDEDGVRITGVRA